MEQNNHNLRLVINQEIIKKADSFYGCPINVYFTADELQKVIDGSYCIAFDDNDLDETVFICVRKEIEE